MNIFDRMALAMWLRNNASYNEVHSYDNIGLVGNVRFSPRAVEVYDWLWSWSEIRFGGDIGRKQEQLVERRGYKALKRRIKRVNRIIDKIKAGN